MTGEGMSPRPWRQLERQPIRFLHDADGDYVLECHQANGAHGANAAGIVHAVNLVFPPPEAVQPPETLLALAVLRGDPSAAYALADELVAKCAAPAGFVSREELIVYLRSVAELCRHLFGEWEQARLEVIDDLPGGSMDDAVAEHGPQRDSYLAPIDAAQRILDRLGG